MGFAFVSADAGVHASASLTAQPPAQPSLAFLVARIGAGGGPTAAPWALLAVLPTALHSQNYLSLRFVFPAACWWLNAINLRGFGGQRPPTAHLSAKPSLCGEVPATVGWGLHSAFIGWWISVGAASPVWMLDSKH